MKCLNSYAISFNRNIANDINARNFETIACAVPLMTNHSEQYLGLGFRHEVNCFIYDGEEDLIEKTRYLLKHENIRSSLSQNGYGLSKKHTYDQRALEIVKLVERGSQHFAAIPSVSGKSSSGVAQGPEVSICIITNAGLDKFKARQQYVARLIRSIDVAGFPADTEIILAGAAAFPIDHPVRKLEMEQQALQGEVCALRNACIKAARGKYVVQVDDDVLFTKGYWASVSSSLSTANTDILCTRLLNPNGTRYWDWAAFDPQRGITLLPYGLEHPGIYATGGHAIYRSSVFEHIRWNEALRHGDNEEFDFARQAREHNFTFSFCPHATVYLQYMHCDAEAAIRGKPTGNLPAECPGYLSAIHALVRETTHDVELRARLSHKVSTLQSSEPTVSILVGCFKYLQRFRIFLQTLAAQDYSRRNIQVVVANPESPDGLHDYLEVSKKACLDGPEVMEVMLSPKFYRNRGAMIQRAF